MMNNRHDETGNDLPSPHRDLLKVSLVISRSVYSSKNQQDLCRAIYKTINKIYSPSQFSIVLYEKERNQLSRVFDSTLDADYNSIHDQSLFRNSFSHFFCKKIQQSHEPLLLSRTLISEYEKDAELSPEMAGAPYPAQWFGMPLLFGKRFVGVLVCQENKSSEHIANSDREILQALSESISEALIQKLKEEELSRNEEITRAIFSIANAVNTTENLDELYVSIHHILGSIIDTRNFRIASYDPNSDYAYFPYFVDENNDTNTPYKNISNSGTLTSEVLVKGQPVFFTKAAAQIRSERLKKKLVGTPSELWLGVPLKTKKRVIGAIIVQSYSDPFRYTQKDADILTAVSEQVALAIDRKKEEDGRRESEAINLTLFEISNAVNTVKSLEELYRSIHTSLGRVLDVTNFYIAIYDEDQNLITFPYYVDTFDDFGTSHTQTLDSDSLTSSVLRSGTPLFLDTEALEERATNNKLEGHVPLVWFGVPLKVREKIIGIVVAQSYTNADLYRGKDQNLLVSVSDQIAIAIERKRYEKALENAIEESKNMAEKARAATKAKSEFLANMSHEIRTPMNAIIGFSELMTNTVLSEKQQDYIETICHSSKALLKIIDDILDYSKIEAGKLTLEKTEFSLPKYLYDLLDLFSDTARKKGIDLLLDISPDTPPVVVGDPIRLRQVLVNLIGNATKFTECGRVEVKVELAVAGKNDDQLRFTITDTGPGIAEDQVEKLFDSFAQADSSTTRKYGGTGLGLSICRDIVRLMHGEIWAQKKSGSGSRFSFTATFYRAQQGGQAFFPVQTGMEGVRVGIWSNDCYYREYLVRLLGYISVKTYCLPNEDETPVCMGGNASAISQDLFIIDADSLRDTAMIDAIGKKPVIIISWKNRAENQHVFERFPTGLFLEKPIRQSALYELIFKMVGNGCGIDQEWHQPFFSGMAAPSGAAVPELSGKQLLLVEDNPINCKVAGEILANMGFLVDTAFNGKEALVMISEKVYDAVLMDVQMPEMDGYEATLKIRKQESRRQLRTIPIIAMTAHAMKGDKEKCLAAGMNDYITKPINTTLLQATLTRWLVSDAVEVDDNEVPDTLYKSGDAESDLVIDGINFREGLERIGGNRLMYENLLIEFAGNCRSARKEIPTLIEDESYEQVRRIIHTIKGMAGNLSANLLFAAAIEVERSTGSNDSLLNGSGELEAMLSEILRIENAVDLMAQGQREVQVPETEEDVGVLVRKLWYFVLNSDINALECFEDVERRLREQPYRNILAELKSTISELNFDGAADSLQTLADTMGVALDNRSQKKRP